MRWLGIAFCVVFGAAFVTLVTAQAACWVCIYNGW
jgi:hypothetical protein